MQRTATERPTIAKNVALALLRSAPMSRRLAKLFLLLLAVYACVTFWPWRAIRHQPGVLVAAEPVQIAMPPVSITAMNGQQLEAVAKYVVAGRVLSKKRYWSSDQAKLMPIDVAVGWGRMSDQAILDQLHVSQGSRFFFYEWENQPPIPRGEIETHAANMHVIAATPEMAKWVRNLREGEVVAMRGYLVNVVGTGWRTSLRRNDTGRGACEVFYLLAAAKPAPAKSDIQQGTLTTDTGIIHSKQEVAASAHLPTPN